MDPNWAHKTTEQTGRQLAAQPSGLPLLGIFRASQPPRLGVLGHLNRSSRWVLLRCLLLTQTCRRETRDET